MALWVAVGGALGAVTRWQLSVLAPSAWTTVGINLAGSGCLGALLASPMATREPWRLFLGVGVLGGFTTFSTFSVDLALRLRDGAWAEALGIAAVSVLGGVGAATAGAMLTRGW